MDFAPDHTAETSLLTIKTNDPNRESDKSLMPHVDSLIWGNLTACIIPAHPPSSLLPQLPLLTPSPGGLGSGKAGSNECRTRFSACLLTCPPKRENRGFRGMLGDVEGLTLR
ncbi:hypothetical protein AOLI_G00239780 [Acnodon oligacanthus]